MNRAKGLGDDGFARNCTTVGDPYNDEERSNDLFIGMVRQSYPGAVTCNGNVKKKDEPGPEQQLVRICPQPNSGQPMVQ